MRAALAPAAGALALAAALAPGCDPAPDPRAAVLDTWTHQLALPGYRAFADAAAALSDRADAACAADAPTAAALDAARDAWWTARGRWQALEVFAIGPYDAYPERLGPHIDFAELRPERIEARLADPPTRETIADLGAAERGLPAMEYLLFADPAADWTGARCQYLAAAAADTARLAERLHRAWADDFAARVTAPAGEPFGDVHDAFSTLVNRMGDQVLVLRADRLGRPLGDKAGGAPQPEAVESRYADRARADIRDVLDTIWRMYVGTPTQPGLAALPQIAVPVVDEAGDAPPERTAIDRAFRRAYAEAVAAVEAIDRPLDVAVVETPETVRAAVDALGRLQTVIQVDLNAALAVQLAFGSGDGD